MIANLSRICTAIIVIVVVIIGGIVVLVQPSTLDFAQYLSDVKWAVGLLAIAHGIDTASRP